MADIFDEIEASKKDIFDEIELPKKDSPSPPQITLPGATIGPSDPPQINLATTGSPTPSQIISKGFTIGPPTPPLSDFTIGPSDSGWLARAKRFVKDTVDPRTPYGTLPLDRGGLPLIVLRGLMNLDDVSDNITRNFVMRKDMGPEILAVGDDPERPTTGDPSRDRRIDIAGAILGLLAGSSGISAFRVLRMMLKGKLDFISALKKAGADAATIEKAQKLLPAMGETSTGGGARAMSLPTDDVGAIKAFKEKKPQKSAKGLLPAKGQTTTGQAKIFTRQIPTDAGIDVTPAPKLTNEAEVIGSKFAPGSNVQAPPSPRNVMEKGPGSDVYDPRTIHDPKKVKEPQVQFSSEPGTPSTTAGMVIREMSEPEIQASIDKLTKQLNRLRIPAKNSSNYAKVMEKREKIQQQIRILRGSSEEKVMKVRVPEEQAVRPKGEVVTLGEASPTINRGEILLSDADRRRLIKNINSALKEKGLTPEDVKALRTQKKMLEHNLPPDPQDHVRQVIREAEQAAKNAPNPEDVKKIAELAVAPDSDKVKRIHAMGAWFRSMDNWLMDHGGESVVKPIREAVRAGDAWKYEWFSRVDEILEGVREGSKEAEIIGRYMRGERVEGLTPELQRIGNRLRTEVFEPIIQQVRNDSELKDIIGEVGYIQNYFPELEKAWRTRYGEDNALALVHDLNPEWFKAKFFKKRTDKAKDPMLDVVSVMRAYLRGSAKTLFDVKGYAAAEKVLRSLPAGPEGFFRDIASKYAKTFIGQPSTRGDVGVWHEIANKIHDWYYKAFIGFNPISAGINLTQTANTFIEVGTKHVVAAMVDVFKGNKELEKIFKSTGVLGEFPGMEISSRLQGNVDNSLFYLFRKAEALNRKIAFYAGYKEAQALGKRGADAVEHALDVVHKTQFTYGRSSSVAHASVPILGQFSNYPLKQLEFLVSAVKRPEQRKRLMALMGIVAAAELSTGGSINEFAREYGGQFFPGIGPGIKDLGTISATVAGYRKTSPEEVIEAIGRRTPGVGGVMATWKTLEKVLAEEEK